MDDDERIQLIDHLLHNQYNLNKQIHKQIQIRKHSTSNKHVHVHVHVHVHAYVWIDTYQVVHQSNEIQHDLHKKKKKTKTKLS
jgi:hypothetical protein